MKRSALLLSKPGPPLTQSADNRDLVPGEKLAEHQEVCWHFYHTGDQKQKKEWQLTHVFAFMPGTV